MFFFFFLLIDKDEEYIKLIRGKKTLVHIKPFLKHTPHHGPAQKKQKLHWTIRCCLLSDSDSSFSLTHSHRHFFSPLFLPPFLLSSFFRSSEWSRWLKLVNSLRKQTNPDWFLFVSHKPTHVHTPTYIHIYLQYTHQSIYSIWNLNQRNTMFSTLTMLFQSQSSAWVW